VVIFTLAQPWVWVVLVSEGIGFGGKASTYLLEDCGEDKAMVYERYLGVVLNSIVDGVDFLIPAQSC
jgi:hypothetical protein